jgi:hypothetical protein
MNFLTNITKPVSPTKSSSKPNLDSSVKAENEATTDVGTSAKAEKLTVDVGKIEEKNSWLTLDDKVSVSDDSSDSEDTFTSIFSKRKIKSVRKWAGKITERLNSPPSQLYKTLTDGTNGPMDSAVSLTKNQPTESHNFPSNDSPEKKELGQPIQSEGGDLSNHEGPISADNQPTESQSVASDDGPSHEQIKLEHQIIQPEYTDVSIHEGTIPTQYEPREQITQDLTDAKGESTLKSPDTDVPQVNPSGIVNTSKESRRKQRQWRSAIDPHTGRTYYYIRGTSKVTWEKPPEMSD